MRTIKPTCKYSTLNFECNRLAVKRQECLVYCYGGADTRTDHILVCAVIQLTCKYFIPLFKRQNQMGRVVAASGLSDICPPRLGRATRRLEVTIPGGNKPGIACEKTVSTVRYT